MDSPLLPLCARATLGDPYANPYPAQAVLIVDEQANPKQRAALVAFRQTNGRRTSEQCRTRDSRHHGTDRQPRAPRVALLRAGQFATVQTRSLNEQDHLCGNEVTFYPPLTELAHSMPAVALTDSYRGPGLGVDWESHGKRSAFVGTFAR